MSDILAIAEGAMRSDAARLDTISHNMANVTSQGFKREVFVRSGFDAHLQAQTPARAVYDFSPGPLQFTGTPLHFAVEGDAWFQLRTPQGVLLTRNGDFQLDAQGRLVSKQGWPVIMDGDFTFTGSTPTVTRSGEVWSGSERVGRFALVSADPPSLQMAGPGLFRGASEPVAVNTTAVNVRQGYLEGSNVNSLSEMVGVIDAMRHAESSQRLMRAYDEALETAITTLGEF